MVTALGQAAALQPHFRSSCSNRRPLATVLAPQMRALLASRRGVATCAMHEAAKTVKISRRTRRQQNGECIAISADPQTSVMQHPRGQGGSTQLDSDTANPAAGSSGWWDALPSRYKIVLGTAVSFIICNMDKVNLSVCIIPMAQDFGWTPSIAGLVQVSNTSQPARFRDLEYLTTSPPAASSQPLTHNSLSNSFASMVRVHAERFLLGLHDVPASRRLPQLQAGRPPHPAGRRAAVQRRNRRGPLGGRICPW